MQSHYLENPEDMPRHFTNAWNQRDADKLASVFVEDADFVNVTGLWWHDREAIRQAHDYGLRVIFPKSELKAGRIKVRRLSGDAAIVHARMKLTGQSPPDDQSNPGRRQTLFSFVLSRSDKGWQCVSAHNTDIVQGMETNIIDEQGNISAVDYRTSENTSDPG